nr:TIGR03067 domain-containing protein [Acidobacteriota bacterium]
QMRIIGTEGPNKSRTIPTIFELEESQLTICYDLSGEKAPDEFKTNADSEFYLVRYQRESY